MPVILLVVVGIAAATAIPLLLLRSRSQTVARTEDELHQPGTRTMSYVVPPGRDPVDFVTALTHAGYLVAEDGPGRLLIGCPREDDPERVRRLLERTPSE